MKRDETLVLDVVAAVVIAAIVLVVSPGTAVDAILVLVLILIWGGGALWARRRDRSLPRVRTRREPPARRR